MLTIAALTVWHRTMLTLMSAHLQAGIQSQGYSQDYKEDYTGHFQFAPEGTETTLDDGVSANVVKLDNFRLQPSVV